MTEVQIDFKKPVGLLSGQQVNAAKALCDTVHNRIVHFDCFLTASPSSISVPHLAGRDRGRGGHGLEVLSSPCCSSLAL